MEPQLRPRQEHSVLKHVRNLLHIEFMYPGVFQAVLLKLIFFIHPLHLPFIKYISVTKNCTVKNECEGLSLDNSKNQEVNPLLHNSTYWLSLGFQHLSEKIRAIEG